MSPPSPHPHTPKEAPVFPDGDVCAVRLAVAQPKNPGGEQSGISRYEAPRPPPPPSPSPASEAATESLARDFDPRLLLGGAPTAASPPPPAPPQPPLPSLPGTRVGLRGLFLPPRCSWSPRATRGRSRDAFAFEKGKGALWLFWGGSFKKAFCSVLCWDGDGFAPGVSLPG